MQTKFLLGVFSLASSTAGLSFSAQSLQLPANSILLLAYPYLSSAIPVIVVDTSAAVNSTSEQTGVCEEHRHQHNETTAGNVTDAEGHRSHDKTLDGDEVASNGTAAEHHKHHHHNCSDIASGAQSRATNAALKIDDDRADTGNSTATERHHHHHNCSDTANEAQSSGSNIALDLGDEETETGNSNNHGHLHRHNCSAADAAAVTQTVVPLPLTSAAV